MRLIDRMRTFLSRIPLKGLVVGFLGLFLLASLFAVVYTYGNPVPRKVEREAQNTASTIVNDVTELNPVQVVDIIVPHSVEEIVEAVEAHDHVSIGGGRNSMGGQTASEKAVQIDMREYNRILSFSTSTKEITVQAGIRWRDIQDYIDPHGLSVKIMQTYSNFTVGGSLSVNVHGRYVGLGPVILSVKSMRLVLADGSIVEASPVENRDLFYSVIGGMGGIAVISDVTLELADNVNVERSRVKIPTSEYLSFFKRDVKANPGVLFHNGDMYPPAFEHISAVSWTVTDKAPTTESRLIPRAKDYWKERIAWVVMSEWPFGRWIREHIIEPILFAGEQPVHTRNYEASYDIAELEPVSRKNTTYVLQEYFVPVDNFDAWVPKMKKVFTDNDVNVLNVSIRHAIADPGAVLSWAKTESFAFVVYYKQRTDEAAKKEVAEWTREMIDAVLSVGGTYYLPYQLHATDDQFHQAYPHALRYFEIKKQYDPTNKFTNKLWDKYYSEEKLSYYSARKDIAQLTASVPDYLRPYDNAYLALPEWYIVYSAEEYASVLEEGLPSHFSYRTAIRDYWEQYERVTALTAQSENNNDDYITVLRVIGVSFTVENLIKGVYENTIGWLSEKVARGAQTPEDQFAAKVAREYGTFLYDYPWYDFPYADYLRELWRLEGSEASSLGAALRRGERKFFLTLELGAKALYSKAIAYATHTKFGVQDDILYAVVSRDGGVTEELLSAPHYHPFTRALLEAMQEGQTRNVDFKVLEIAGNDKITFSYIDVAGSSPVEGTREILRDSEIRSEGGGSLDARDRITVEVHTQDLFAVYKHLASRGIAIEHFYDY